MKGEFLLRCYIIKGQLISKANCQAVNYSKKRMNEFIFSSMQRVFICFLEEIEDSKKAFRNYLTFSFCMLICRGQNEILVALSKKGN